ncbi:MULTISPECIES: hypothetical protein [Cupriavidus]
MSKETYFPARELNLSVRHDNVPDSASQWWAMAGLALHEYAVNGFDVDGEAFVASNGVSVTPEWVNQTLSPEDVADAKATKNIVTQNLFWDKEARRYVIFTSELPSDLERYEFKQGWGISEY